MPRFRSTWLALMGGVLLVTLSISAAFGAAPAGARDATRGQSIASFVHELVFGANEEPEDEPQLDGELEETEETEETEELEETEEGEEAEAASAHGECVSAVAQDREAIGGTNETHGGAVSEAARVTCWETENGEETTDPEEDEEADEEAGSHGACVSEVARDTSAVGGKNDNHGGAVSEAARVTCREDAEAGDGDSEDVSDESGDDELAETAAASDRKAAKADHGRGRPSWAGGGGQGGGHGRGGGRP